MYNGVYLNLSFYLAIILLSFLSIHWSINICIFGRPGSRYRSCSFSTFVPDTQELQSIKIQITFHDLTCYNKTLKMCIMSMQYYKLVASKINSTV